MSGKSARFAVDRLDSISMSRQLATLENVYASFSLEVQHEKDDAKKTAISSVVSFKKSLYGIFPLFYGRLEGYRRGGPM